MNSEIDKQIEYTASKYLGEAYVHSLPKPQYVEMTVGSSNEALRQFKQVSSLDSPYVKNRLSTALTLQF